MIGPLPPPPHCKSSTTVFNPQHTPISSAAVQSEIQGRTLDRECASIGIFRGFKHKGLPINRRLCVVVAREGCTTQVWQGNGSVFNTVQRLCLSASPWNFVEHLNLEVCSILFIKCGIHTIEWSPKASPRGFWEHVPHTRWPAAAGINTRYSPSIAERLSRCQRSFPRSVTELF